MAKQTFTTGQVLTATQMNNLQANDYNWSTSAQTASYVLVAGDKGQTVTMTNAAATTITVNTAIFAAGDTVRIINLGAGTTTITAGTATVNSAGSLAVPQYASGTLWFSSASAAIWIPDDRNSGLALITAQTIGTAVSSVTVSNAFSSSYENYLILMNNVDSSIDGTTLNMTLGSTNTGYYDSFYVDRATTATSSTVRVSNGVAWDVGVVSTNDDSYGSWTLFGPNLAKRTGMVGMANAGQFTVWCGGNLANTTQYTAFTLSVTAGTLTGGTIRVYGYQNS
jgi:hypothetical protein